MNATTFGSTWEPHYYPTWAGHGRGPCVYTNDPTADHFGCAAGRYIVQYDAIDLDPVIGDPRLTARAWVLIPLIVRDGWGALLLESERNTEHGITRLLREDIAEQATFCGIGPASLDFKNFKR